MTVHPAMRTRRSALIVLAAGLAGLAITLVRPTTSAQGQAGDPLGAGQSDQPIEIEAEAGIEWRKNEKLYIARGNASAKRGDFTVRADTLSARYRDKPDGGSEIWQIEADGNVRMTSPGRNITGNHAVYNLDTRVLQVTGPNLGVDTGKEKLIAEDHLEYQDGPQIAIARGNVVVTQSDRRVRADKMTGHFQRLADGKQELVRLEAEGNVQIQTPDTYAESAAGDYDLTKDFMTLSGNVKVTNGGNQFNGEFAEVDVKSGVSRLLGSPGGTGKVNSLIIPSPSPSPPQ